MTSASETLQRIQEEMSIQEEMNGCTDINAILNKFGPQSLKDKLIWANRALGWDCFSGTYPEKVIHIAKVISRLAIYSALFRPGSQGHREILAISDEISKKKVLGKHSEKVVAEDLSKEKGKE